MRIPSVFIDRIGMDKPKNGENADHTKEEREIVLISDLKIYRYGVSAKPVPQAGRSLYKGTIN